jgi:uncharacterized lipoprotein YbaY
MADVDAADCAMVEFSGAYGVKYDPDDWQPSARIKMFSRITMKHDLILFISIFPRKDNLSDNQAD